MQHLGLLALCGLLLASPGWCAGVALDVALGSAPASAPLPRGFTSFSGGEASLDVLSAPLPGGGHAPRASWVSLMALLGGGANVRLGHFYARAGTNHSFPPAYIELNATSAGRLQQALAAYGGTASGLIPPLEDAGGQFAAATGLALSAIPGVVSVELANEPDISSFRGNFSGYAARLRVWLSALAAAGAPAALVDAPVLAGTAWWPQMPAFLAEFAPRLHAFAQHRYGLSACSRTPPTAPALLQVEPTWSSANDTALLAAAAAAGLPWQVGEGNTVSCNGSQGVSDVFASALYAIDASLSAAAANATAFKWHGLGYPAQGYFYQPIFYDPQQLRVPGWDAPQPRPLFLGLWLLAEAAPAGSALLQASANATGSALLRAWAVARAGGGRSVVALHKDAGAGAARVRVAAAPGSAAALCRLGQRAELLRLLPGTGGASARQGSTYANQSFDGGGGVPGGQRAGEAVVCSAQGVFEFQLPSVSAAVLRF